MSFANDDVLEFYKDLPFNIFGNTETHREFIRSGASLNSHPVLIEKINNRSTILEIGCGVGRFSAQIADRFGASVTAIDFNPGAIQYAREAASLLGLKVNYEVADLFKFESPEKFDVCVSLGVLHHTNNCIVAIQHCLENYVKPGGYFYVGLYHLYGRRPFLNHFSEMAASGASNDELFREYARLDNGKTDQTYLMSWFRDQVLHPHETQHTLKEITEVCAKSGARLLSTSINQFEEFTSELELFDREKDYEAISKQRILEGKYFPGFFTALYQKN